MRLTIILLALLSTTTAAEAQTYRPRVVYVQPRVQYTQARPVLVQRPQDVRYATQAVAPVVQGMTPSQNVYGEAGAFLQALNLWRASRGVRPASWSSALAAYAATNRGIHQPGSSGGGSQCWASTGSLLAALEMWKRSPPHAAILLSGTVVGASPCPSGATANVR